VVCGPLTALKADWSREVLFLGFSGAETGLQVSLFPFKKKEGRKKDTGRTEQQQDHV